MSRSGPDWDLTWTGPGPDLGPGMGPGMGPGPELDKNCYQISMQSMLFSIELKRIGVLA